MPRHARIDNIGLLQHVMVRGIERRDIFHDDLDRTYFLARLSGLLVKTDTACLAWALMSNHFHLLLRPQKAKLALLMRRLLTGYAVTFNLRHQRSGHLFQNRYKSIVCEEESYLLELVRYIHLNPLRARVVATMDALDEYPWTGHTVLMGNREFAGQANAEVLACFGTNVAAARQAYRLFVEDGATKGYRDEFSGGGMTRSCVLSRSEPGEDAYDERILGDGSFVEDVLERNDEDADRRKVSLDALIAEVAKGFGISAERLCHHDKNRKISKARAVACFLAVRKFGFSCVEVARRMGLSPSGVSRCANAGEGMETAKETLEILVNIQISPTSP